MNKDKIELHYISDYEDPETGEVKEQIEGMSIVSKSNYLTFLATSEWNPCECGVRGCLSCFLDEEDAWADGYGDTCTELWWGIDPATGEQWNPEEELTEVKQ